MTETIPPQHSLSVFLGVLFESAPRRSLVELRWSVGETMRRSFHDPAQLYELQRRVERHATDHDVYFGVLARWRQGGRRRDLAGSPRVVWADCDGPAAARALSDFAPAPALVLRSGSGENRHAFWLLSHAETLALVERANRRLAVALSADGGVVTGAGAILRLPGTLNHKHSPPTRVELELYEPARRYPLAAIVRGLPPDPATARQATSQPRRHRGDRLLEVPPEIYVQRLLGVHVGPSRKVRCPLHDDHRPSLHVYPEPERGWFCFGCRHGGTVIDLAAALWKRPTTGPGFTALRADLERLLLS